MFNTLTEKLRGAFSGLFAQKKITEDNISEAVRDVRLALLDADVNYTVVSQFIKRVKETAVGQDVIRSISPGDAFIKIVHDELVALMGQDEAVLHLSSIPSVFMLCGLQGSGKTTQCVKLAAFIKKQYNKRSLLVACDLQRPAAVLQLQTLAKQADIDFFHIEGATKPAKVAKEARIKAVREGFDVVIVDTAGRLHVDDELMAELEDLKKIFEPQEILFVANATTGQDAVKTAFEFDKRLAITGTILTMLDGNARAGAAISIREVTKKPLKFEGTGEKIGDFQLFHPQSMADRILGMGDIINLVRKSKEHFDEQEQEQLEKKLKNASFTYDDYLSQMSKLKKMGSMKSLLAMMPGMDKFGDFAISDKEVSHLEAIILSMTPNERLGLDELEPSRRRRIALGSGTSVDEVNRMVKGFKQVKQMMKKMPQIKSGLKKDPKMLEQLSDKKFFNKR